MDDATKFLNALAHRLPQDERLILCGFRGDPNEADPKSWRPRPWRPGADIPFDSPDNGYVTVSSFGKTDDGTYRRRQASFAAGRVLMVDDIGTKVSHSIIAGIEPSAIVETSPGNFQAWFFLDKPERDQARFDGVIRAFISGKLLGADPGMSGVTRVGRIPGFTNGKKQHNGWICKLTHWNPKLRFSVESILKTFSLELAGRAMPSRSIPPDVAKDRIRHYFTVYRFLENRGMLKRSHPDPSGWSEISCPWVDEHTNAANNGAGIREPAPENSYFGSFVCHHGSHIDRGWRELTDWVAEQAAEELDAIEGTF